MMLLQTALAAAEFVIVGAEGTVKVAIEEEAVYPPLDVTSTE